LIVGHVASFNQVIAQEEIPRPLRKSVILSGGAALPASAIGATSGSDAGFAKTGFVLVVEHSAEALRHFLVGLEVNASWLPIDGEAATTSFENKFGTTNVTLDARPWLIIGVLGSVGFDVDAGSTSHFYGRGKIGLAFGNSPRISMQVNNAPVTQNSASADAFELGFGFGVIINDAFDVGVHFISAQPEYKVTTEKGGTSTSSEFGQPTSVFQLRVGYVISLN
jgi:hypothetical protein